MAEKEYIEKDVALETTYEPFTMSMCMTVPECNGMNRAREMIFKQLRDIPAADVVEVDSVIPFVRVCDRKEYIKNSEKLINEYLAELLERFGVRCLAQSDNINGTVKFWAEKMDGGVNDGKAD